MENSLIKILDNEELETLEIFKKYGKKVAYTDMYLIAGGNPNSKDMDRVPDILGLKSRVAPKNESTRLVIDSKQQTNKTTVYNGIKEIEFGEYPQYVSAHSVNETLEYHYQKMLFDESNVILIPTGNTYTMYQNGDLVKYNEYYHDGKRYIRVKINNQVLLSNANTYYKDDYVWIEVSKVKWLVDEKSGKMISKIAQLPALDKSYALFIANAYMKKDMFNSSMNKKDILSMISYVMNNIKEEYVNDYLELINKYPSIEVLSVEELEELLLNISKLNDKINNLDYELTWKMK